MKKIRLIIIASMVVIGAAIVLLMTHEEQKAVEDKMAEVERTKSESVEILYAEGDEDLEYNYIANPQELEGLEVTASFAMDFNDEVDKQLKAINITGEPVSITALKTQSDKTIISLETDISHTKVTATYSRRENTLSVITEQ